MPQVGESRRIAHCLPDGRSSRATGLALVGQAVEPGRCPSASYDDGQVQADASAGPARPARLRAPGSDSGRRRAGRGHRPLDDGHRTPGRSDAHAGHRTPGRRTSTLDTGHRSRGHRTRGHWTVTLDTGRRTLAEDRTGDKGMAGIRTSWVTTLSACLVGTTNRVPVDGAYGARHPRTARR